MCVLAVNRSPEMANSKRKGTRKKVSVGRKGRAKTAASKKTAPGQIASRFEAGRGLDFLRDLPV